ncbi:helix-turn-helix domain-containing protein [Pseudooceanicola sp. GBMRC 2024]|uniref:Helix-turn-helix domain-containing protein n=1 Tax=Pseudooceanicola albus TaxID=2692189 RepID=A0A6L7G2J8_9RHOB|nr:helix-turn-helix domain-containing protein [Pseudooceanicola albus]MXN17738.1 helix-turn-helix domain-containing protein [Pseudooceanicola albus]
MNVVFQTGDCAPAERLQYWHQMIRQHHSPVTARQAAQWDFADRDTFKGWSRVSSWGKMGVFNTISSSISYHQGQRDLEDSTAHDFHCLLVVEGRGLFRHNGRQMSFNRGDILFYDARQLYSLGFPQDISAITLRIPRPQILSRLHQADRQFAICIDGRRSLGKLLGSMMKSIAESDGATGIDGSAEGDLGATEGPIIDIVGAAVRDSLAGHEALSPGQERLLQRIKGDLIGQLDLPGLSAEAIARMHGVSVSTLNRTFAAEGTTVMRWLWSQRLAGSYRALAEGRVRQVTEAAFLFGFKDSSHFSRAFKKEYGISPRALISG